jgi:uncharacterized protein YwgA
MDSTEVMPYKGDFEGFKGVNPMTRYQLAKLISWVETLHSRKRLQKVVAMLQAAGCPIEADFRLHHFGPYSDDLAHLADEMTQAKLLIEEEISIAIGSTYDYRLSDKAKKLLYEFEATPQGKQQAAAFEKYRSQAQRLLNVDLKDLEHAATIAYFRKSGLNWAKAIDKACEFKKLKKDSSARRRAESLARELVE